MITRSVVSNILWVYLKGIRRFENSIERCSNPYFPSCLHLVYQYWLTAKEEIRSLKSNFWTLQFELSKLSVFNNLHHSLCIYPIFSLRGVSLNLSSTYYFLYSVRDEIQYVWRILYICRFTRLLLHALINTDIKSSLAIGKQFFALIDESPCILLALLRTIT